MDELNGCVEKGGDGFLYLFFRDVEELDELDELMTTNGCDEYVDCWKEGKRAREILNT